MSAKLYVETNPGEPDVDLSGKTFLVTGGSRGVGAEVARIAASCGADVAINYRNKARRAEQVADTVREHGRKALLVRADITDKTSVASMYQKLKDEFDGLDVLVLNASGGLEKDVADDYAMRLNRDSQMALVRASLPLLSRGGVIVFVTSHLAHYHGEKEVMSEYEPVAASKKAGEVELWAMIRELAEAGIRLVVVSGDLIDGTITPKLLDRMRPGTISQRRDEAGWLPTTEDFAASIVLAAGRDDLESGATIYVGSTDW